MKTAQQPLLIDGHKLPWHMDRVEAWERGERIAPVTIDMALTRACDASCSFCFAEMQENDGHTITREVMENFLVDSARMGVRSIALVSDGESLLSPHWTYTVRRGKELGIAMSSGSNCRLFTPEKQEEILKDLSYIRINFPAGTAKRYCQIMGVNMGFYAQVTANIQNMVKLKKRDGLDVTLGMQMVLMPEDGDQILPFTRLARDLGVDYAIIKHVGDDPSGGLKVKRDKLDALVPLLKEAQTYATDEFQVIVPWSKFAAAANGRNYQRCYGPPFLIQISGSGLVAPCGGKFNSKYAKFHMGNICEERWWDIWQGERYWEVMDYLRSEDFNAQTACGNLCRHHKVNEALNQHKEGINLLQPSQDVVEHEAFI